MRFRLRVCKLDGLVVVVVGMFLEYNDVVVQVDPEVAGMVANS